MPQSRKRTGEQAEELAESDGEYTVCSGLRITENDPLIHIKAAAANAELYFLLERFPIR